MSTNALFGGHAIQLLEGGNDYFPSLVAAIDASVHEVRLETYIFHFERSGELVALALERAAQRGVSVYVVMDGVGTGAVPLNWQTRFQAAGVHWQLFSPLGRWGLLLPTGWRRLHRKLCVVDAEIAFCGGINVLDDYFDPSHGPQTSPRFDFAVRVVGPLVWEIHTVLVQFWRRLLLTTQLERLQFQVARQTWRSDRKGKVGVGLQDIPSETRSPSLHAALVLRDNVHHRSRIERSYRKAIASARHEVLISNAYFLPGRKLRTALIHAARRGVQVKLLLQGRYEYFMQYHAARPVYGALLAAGVEIHEYNTGFLHAKVAVVDGHWATVGSSNLDPLSMLLAREANVVVEDVQFAQDLRARLLVAMRQHGKPVNPQEYAQRPLRQRFLDGLAFAMMRSALFMTGKRY